MSSYKIYLSKSSEVASLIYSAMQMKVGKGILSTGSGMVNEDVRIPAIYHGKTYFYCFVEYCNGETWDNPQYELIIA